MNDPDRQQGLWSIPGDGVLARQGSLVLLSSIDRRGFVEALLGLLARASEGGGDGRGLTDAIGQAVENDQSWGGSQSEPGPAVLAFGPAGAGLAVTVSGTAWAEITTAHGTHRLVAGQPSMLLRSVVGIPVQAVRGGLGGQASADRTDRFSRLDSGTVRASGLSYYSGQPAQSGAAGSPGTAPPAPVPAAPGPAAAGPAAAAAAAAPSAFGMNEATPPAGEPAPPYAPEPYAAEPYAPEPYAGEPASFDPGPAEFGQPPPPFEPAPPAAPPAADPGFGQPTPDAGFGQPPPGDASVPGPAPEFPYEPDVAVPPPPPTSLGPATPSGTQPAPEFGPDEGDGESGVPMVVGVYCKNGHFGDPDARSCVVCGTAISKRSSVTQRGPRPMLGVLVLDDGATVELDGDYIIGREPTREPSVSAGQARPLRVVDAESTVSRVHARVHLEGWQVLLTDLGSANGTRIQPPGAKSEQPLDPQVPVQLRHGTRVFVGAQGIRYEPPRG